MCFNYESRAHAEMEVRGVGLDAVPVQIELKIKKPVKKKPKKKEE